MTPEGEDSVALRILHTADWHLGVNYQSFDEIYRNKLRRSRLDVLDEIFGTAERERVDVVLCAGDLFDSPEPGEKWWKPVLKKLGALSWSGVRKVFMLPGNHDPLLPTSVWAASHSFRQQLPDFVTVIDKVGFEASIGDNAVLYSSPCMDRSFSADQAAALPKRESGDERIRIAMVHGMTFDLEGHQGNFPIGEDVASERGFDYLALGDTHGYRNVASQGKAPMVYPGTPEATTFGEKDPGHIVVVLIKRSRRVSFEQRLVGRWTWRSESVSSIDELRRLARDDLRQTVLSLTVAGHFQPAEFREAEEIFERLCGNELDDGISGAVRLDRGGMKLDNTDIDSVFTDAPHEFLVAAKRLAEIQAEGGHDAAVAERAILKLCAIARGA